MSRQLKFLVTLSVLLNLLMLGVITGHASRYFVADHDNSATIFEQITSSLPADKRPVVDEILKRADQDTGELHEQLSESRKQAANILKAEAFDKDAYLAQVQRINKLRGQLIERKAEAISEVAGKLSAQDRAVVAEILRHPPVHPPAD